jgi:hypothetical protein
MRMDRQMDRQTYMTKLVDAFSNFAKAPKIEMFVLHVYEKLNHKTLLAVSFKIISINYTQQNKL